MIITTKSIYSTSRVKILQSLLLANAAKLFLSLRRPGRLLASFRQAYVEFYAHSRGKLILSGLIGATTFPLYYLPWVFFDPQPYENLSLRIFGALACLLVVFNQLSASRDTRAGMVFSFATVTFSVPYFFVFMLLMNGFTPVWQVSTMSALVYLAILLNTLNFIASAGIGVTAAILTHLAVVEGTPFSGVSYSFILIAFFSLVGLALLKYSESIITEDKMKAATVLASHIAHEMRTPLLSIKLDADRTHEMLPTLVETHVFAKENGWTGKKIGPAQLNGMMQSLGRIRSQTSSANLVVDMLLRNLGDIEVLQEDLGPHSMAAIINGALGAYVFKDGERERISLELDADFVVTAPELLVRHIFFNLVKNSMRAIDQKGSGVISIKLERGPTADRVIFADTGIGIPDNVLNYIFVPFYVGPKKGSGTGVGLPFCKTVMERLGGNIECRSRRGEGTEFTLTFPRQRPA